MYHLPKHLRLGSSNPTPQRGARGGQSPIRQSAQHSPLKVSDGSPQPPFIENGVVIVPKHFRFYGNAALLKQEGAAGVVQDAVAGWEQHWNKHPVNVTVDGKSYPLMFRFTSSIIPTEKEAKQIMSTNLNLNAAGSQSASSFHPEWSFVRLEDIDASAHNSRLGKGFTEAFNGDRIGQNPQNSADNAIFLPSALLRSNNAVHELIHQFLTRSEIAHVQGQAGIVEGADARPLLSIRTIRIASCDPHIPNAFKVKDGKDRAQIYADRDGKPTVIAVETAAPNATDGQGATYRRVKPDGTDGDVVTFAMLEAEEKSKSKFGLNYFFQSDLREVTAADKQLIIDRYFTGGRLPSMVGGATNTYFDAAGREFYFDPKNTNRWLQY